MSSGWRARKSPVFCLLLSNEHLYFCVNLCFLLCFEYTVSETCFLSLKKRVGDKKNGGEIKEFNT